MSRRYAVVYPDGSMTVLMEPRRGREAALCRGMAIEEADGWNERERKSKKPQLAKVVTVEVSDIKEIRLRDQR